MRLATIIVNFNGSADTVGLLQSLERQTERSFTVLVFDNDSLTDQRELLGTYAAASPLALDIVYSPENRGFAGGCNLGIRKALAQGAEWILLLNPDTTVSDGFIATLADVMPAEPGIVGLPLDEGGRVAFAGRVRWLASTLPHLYRKPDPEPRDSESLYVIGAAMLVHRAVFERAGLLDERFFLYFEDAEFTLRARRNGFPCVFVDRPPVRHAVSASTRNLGSPLLLRYHMRNALLFNRLHGPLWVRISLHFWAFFVIVKQSVKSILMPRRRAPARAIAAGIVDYYASRFGNITSSCAPDRRHRV
jgi:hypothetical protein